MLNKLLPAPPLHVAACTQGCGVRNTTVSRYPSQVRTYGVSRVIRTENAETLEGAYGVTSKAGGGASSFVDCLCGLIVDHASISF